MTLSHGKKIRVVCFVVLLFNQFCRSGCLIVRSVPILVLEQGVATCGDKHLNALFIALVRSVVKGGVPIIVLNVDAGWTCSNYQLQLFTSAITTCSVMGRCIPILQSAPKTPPPPPHHVTHQKVKGWKERREWIIVSAGIFFLVLRRLNYTIR